MISKELKTLIDGTCRGHEPTDQQMDVIIDLVRTQGADVNEVSAYIEQVKALSAPTPALKTKKRILASILAILFGGNGFHKFYMGKVFPGVCCFACNLLGIGTGVFFFSALPAIVGFIEGILYLSTTKSDEQFTAKYVTPKKRLFF